MKRYIVFAGDTYYPGCAWFDFQDDFDTLEEAETYADGLKNDWHQIVDLDTKRMVRFQ